MLTLRTRGKNQTWYIRGTVTLGDKQIVVKEFSSGTSDRVAATHLTRVHEQELVQQLMFGARAQVAKATIADAFELYLSKAKPPGSSDVLRLGKMNELIGDMPISEVREAWVFFRKVYFDGHAPAGQDRYRSVLQAAVNLFFSDHGLDPVKIRSIPFDNQRISFLSRPDRDTLLGSYSNHTRPIATMLAFQGPRNQEALQSHWGIGGVDMERRTIFFPRTKTNNPRIVAIHDRVFAEIERLWVDRGRPDRGHVFLNRKGQPYTDTRDLPVQGGNPIDTAHSNACRKAGIVDFTVHDWRHHWASHCVMAGISLITIMQMGGWKSLRMVQRYAAVDAEHMHAAVHLLT
jgi:integrase